MIDNKLLFFQWLQRDLNSLQLSSLTNTQPFRQTGQMIELCYEYLPVWWIWLCVLIISRTRFRVNLRCLLIFAFTKGFPSKNAYSLFRIENKIPNKNSKDMIALVLNVMMLLVERSLCKGIFIWCCHVFEKLLESSSSTIPKTYIYIKIQVVSKVICCLTCLKRHFLISIEVATRDVP